MALLKVPKLVATRTNRSADASLVNKANVLKDSNISLKGGNTLYTKIAQISTLVESKLGKYSKKYLTIRNEDELREYISKMVEIGIGAVDTETSSLDPISCELAGICLYSPGLSPAYVPMNHVSYVTGIKLKDQLSKEIVADNVSRLSGTKLVFHNAKFDIRVCKNQLGVKLNAYWDTYLAQKCLNENEPAGLKDIHLKYCKDTSLDSEVLSYSSLFEGIPFTLIPVNTAVLYAAGDPIKTFEVYEFQKKHLNRQRVGSVADVFFNIEMPLIDVIVDMEDTGISLDFEYCDELIPKYKNMLKTVEDKFFNQLEMYRKDIDKYLSSTPNPKISDPINIGSPPQIACLLYDIIGLTSPDKNKPRATGEEILLSFNSDLTKTILEYRGITKLLSTYIEKMPQVVNRVTGRIHASFNQYGAVTGRFSSSDPNMQNIPSGNKEIRKMFVASPGHVLIGSDFSQQEPRTLAHMSGDTALIQAYTEGKDIYAWIASSIYHVDYDECKEFRSDGTKNPAGKKRRDSVKSIILGIMYGRGAKAISEQLGVSQREAQDIVDKFFGTFPSVKSWMDATVQHARDHGYVKTAWGRKRRLPDVQLAPYEFTLIDGNKSFDPLAFDMESISYEVDEQTVQFYTQKLNSTWSMKEKNNIKQQAKQQGIMIRDNGGKIADAERQCVNSVIQGSSADMLKIAMIKVHSSKELNNLGFKLLLQVHDELIGECPRENAKQVSEIFTSIMIDAAKEKISVPMKCDAEIVERWYGEAVDLG